MPIFVYGWQVWLYLVGREGGKITIHEIRSFPAGEIEVLIRGAPLRCEGWKEVSLSCFRA